MNNQESSLFRDALIRLTTNKLSLFSLIYILLLVVIAVITPFIAPYDYASVSYTHLRAHETG